MTKWSPFSRGYFQGHFLEWKLLNFNCNFTELCSLGPNWQYCSIGSDNGLHRPGDKPLSESVMISLMTHICVTPPQWVKNLALVITALHAIWCYNWQLWGDLIVYCRHAISPFTWSLCDILRPVGWASDRKLITDVLVPNRCLTVIEIRHHKLTLASNRGFRSLMCQDYFWETRSIPWLLMPRLPVMNNIHMWDGDVLVLFENESQQPVAFLCREVRQNTNSYLCFLETI